MKILYFHQHFNTPQGSSGIRSYEFSKKLISYGHEVTIICGSYSVGSTGLEGKFKNGYRTGNVDGIDVIEFDLKYTSNFSFFQRLLSFFRFAFKSIFIAIKYDYDIVYATSTPLSAGIPGIIAKHFKKKPFIFEVRDLWPDLPKAMGIIKNKFFLKILYFLEWVIYKSADHIIALSPGMAKGINKKGISNSKITMIPNGCDIDYFNKITKSMTFQFIEDNNFYAIFSGSHGIANGLDALIEVGKELKKQNIVNIKIILIGDGAMKKELVETKNFYSLNNLIFLDPVNKFELVNIYKNVDVGLQILANVPDFYDGTSPNKFFDYLSAGLPIIINYPGWLSKIIEQKNCGFFAEPGNPQKIINHLLKLQKDKDLYESMKKNCYELASKEFNRADLSIQMVDCLEEIYKLKINEIT